MQDETAGLDETRLLRDKIALDAERRAEKQARIAEAVKLLTPTETEKPPVEDIPLPEVRPEIARKLLESETPRQRQRVTRLKMILEKAMDGTLPTFRPLEDGELQKFKPVHVAMALQLAKGGTVSEVAEAHDYSVQTVSLLQHHPYTHTLKLELLAEQADAAADPMLRMKGLAHEMIDTKLEIVRDPETNKSLRDRIASDMLDRGGYGATQKVESESRLTISIPAALAERLTKGLDEIKELSPASYEAFIHSPTKLLEGEVREDLAPSAGHTDEFAGASPGAPSATSAQRVA